jgi:hypothetical protein
MQPVVRGWTRFFWNVRLGSAPAGPWLARTENARSGHRLYKRVADLELWSDNGLDRRHLLEVLTTSLQASGSLVDTDDGWRDWDIETRTGRWWRLRFSSVTEYHGEGRCLTRVRAASRASMITVLLFALFPVVGLNLVFIAGWHPVWVLGFLFVGTVLFETLHRATVNRAANQVLAIATAAGFTAAVRGAGAAMQS